MIRASHAVGRGAVVHEVSESLKEADQRAIPGDWYVAYARFEHLDGGTHLHDTPAETIADNLRAIVSGVPAFHIQFGVPDGTVV